MGLRLYLTLVVLGLTAVIKTNSTGVSQDETYQQELTGAEYASNKLDVPSQENQLPFYYKNNFDCTKHQYAFGMYADIDFQCQVYHVCHNNRKETFLCPHGTLFNQRLLVCDHWHSVNCQNTPSFYYVNEELGKVSNRTRYDGRDGPYSHRRFPEDSGQSYPYSPSYTTQRQGQQFPSSHGRSTPLPFSQSTTEAPTDSYRSREQTRFPSHSQSGRYYPQAPYDQRTNYGQPQVGLQPGQQDRQAPGYGYQNSRNNIQGSSYGNRQQNFNYDQRPELGSRGSLHGDRQSRFNQPNIGRPASGTQQNRDLTFTHYSQSGGQRTSQDNRANNTWPVDQRNATQGSQYGRQPSPTWRYGQDYPENSLLGSRYNGQKPPTSQYGHHLPDRTTPGSFHRHQPAVSQDGRFPSQVLTSGLTHDNQPPSTILPGQASYGRSPESLYNRDQTTNLESGQKQPEFGTPGLFHGRRDPTATQYGQQQPSQPGSYGPSHRPHRPFTTHGGQIYPPVRTADSTNSQQKPSQYDQQPHARTLGTEFNQPQPPFTSQYGRQQPHVGTSGSLYGKQPSTSQGRQQIHGLTSGFQHQPVTHHRQNQSHIATSGPPYNQQQPIIPGSRPSHPQTGQSIGSYGHQQPPTGQGPQYKSQFGSQLNRSQTYNQQNPATRFHQSQTPGNIGRQPEFGRPAQPLNRVSGSRTIPEYGAEQNATSVYEYNRQGSQFDRESKAIQSPPWQQPWNSQGNQPFDNKQPNIVHSQINSQEYRGQRSQYGRNDPANAQGYKYDWQKPGSPQYSFQQPQYRNIHSSTNPASPQLTPNSSIGSPGQSGRFNTVKEGNRFWNHQSGNSWNLRGNNTGNVPIGTQFGGELAASKASQDKNLKPILVYQRHIPVTINGNGTNNKTEDDRQHVPVYKVYYVKGDQKETVIN